MPLLMYPLALFALAAVPVFISIYLFRNRFRRQPVSSLMLWQSMLRAKEGGTRVQRLILPWLFLLELAIILLLICAATDPRVPVTSMRRRLIVILDNSASMAAGPEAGSARDRAMAFLKKEIARGNYHAVQLILCGNNPRRLEPEVISASGLTRLFEQWHCTAPAAELEEAIVLALELGGPATRILVVSDHAPEHAIETDRIIWKAFGSPLVNAGFVGASRSRGSESERCLLEIAGSGGYPVKTQLQVEYGERGIVLERALILSNSDPVRVRFDVLRDVPLVRARLTMDSMPLDNEIMLVPTPEKRVRTALVISNTVTAARIRKALTVTGMFEERRMHPELLITDSDNSAAGTGEVWIVQCESGQQSQSYTGPFIIDHGHPVAEGLHLEGVAWGASPTMTLPGKPVISVGNIVLMTDEKRVSGEHILHMQYVPELSTLDTTPNWPVLFWNILNWRAENQPGIRESNIRAGVPLEYHSETLTGEITVHEPDNRTRQVPIINRTATIETEEPGMYRLENGSGTSIVFAVQFTAPEESDLQILCSGTWGDWLDKRTLQKEYAGLMWIALAAALAGLAVHQYATARAGGRV